MNPSTSPLAVIRFDQSFETRNVFAMVTEGFSGTCFKDTPQKKTARSSKMMVRRQSFPFKNVPFSGDKIVHFRGYIRPGWPSAKSSNSCCNHSKDPPIRGGIRGGSWLIKLVHSTHPKSMNEDVSPIKKGFPLSCHFSEVNWKINHYQPLVS